MNNLTVVDTFPLQRWKEMSQFLADHYASNYIMRDRKLFEWQFNRAKNIGSANLICAYQKDQLIAVLGYMPLDIFWGDLQNTIKAVWMANWMVAPEFRLGVGALCMRRLIYNAGFFQKFEI